MSYKSSLVKYALNKTPKRAILWAANKKLKGMAKLTNFKFNSDERKLYAEILLVGEEQAIEIWLEKFTLIATDDERYQLAIQHVQSTKPWLDALLNKMVLGRRFTIPKSQTELVWKLFANNSDEQEDGSVDLTEE